MAELGMKSISARKKTDWSAQSPDTNVAKIKVLGLRRCLDVEEGMVHIQRTGDPRWWVSDGFTYCTGIVIHAPSQGYIPGLPTSLNKKHRVMIVVLTTVVIMLTIKLMHSVKRYR